MKSDRAWWLMVISYASLLILLFVGTYAGAPESIQGDDDLAGAAAVFSFFKAIPLLLFIPGLVKKSHYAASWLSYMSMLYFVVIIASGGTVWMWYQVITIVVLFLSSMMFTRWKKAEENADQAAG